MEWLKSSLKFFRVAKIGGGGQGFFLVSQLSAGVLEDRRVFQAGCRLEGAGNPAKLKGLKPNDFLMI